MSLKPAVNNVSFNKKSNSTDTDKTKVKLKFSKNNVVIVRLERLNQKIYHSYNNS